VRFGAPEWCGQGRRGSRIDAEEARLAIPRPGCFWWGAARPWQRRGRERRAGWGLHHDLMRAMREAIEGAVGEDGVVEEGHPLVHRAVARDSVESGSPAPGGPFVCFPFALGLLSEESNDFNID